MSQQERKIKILKLNTFLFRITEILIIDTWRQLLRHVTFIHWLSAFYWIISDRSVRRKNGMKFLLVQLRCTKYYVLSCKYYVLILCSQLPHNGRLLPAAPHCLLPCIVSLAPIKQNIWQSIINCYTPHTTTSCSQCSNITHLSSQHLEENARILHTSAHNIWHTMLEC